jgi:preprotein translocase subunit Sec61beta
MAKKDKKNLPASGAGLVRYFEDETKGPKLSPNHIVVMVILMGFFCIALRLSGT